MPIIQRIDHVNLVASDLPGMTAFYREVLGLKVTKEVTISGPWIEAVVGLKDVEADVVYLEADEGPRIELIFYRHPRGSYHDDSGKPNTLGLRHLAFGVSDMDAAVDRLKQANVKLFSEVQQVPDAQVKYAGGVRKRLIYFHDPEGNLLEFCSYE